MKKIAVVAYETNAAVCSSMMMHVDMMRDAGLDIILYIHQDVPIKNFETFAYSKKVYNSFKELNNYIKSDKSDFIWCTNPLYVFKLRFHGIRLPIYLWQQGDGPAESFMHHKSRLRVWVLRRLLSYTFKKVAGVVFVSDAMRDYYIKEYGFSKPCAVVPCLSEFANEDLIENRIPESYVYIGGLSVWQCFDEILMLYKKIRKPHSVFHIITLDKDIAISKVNALLGSQEGIEVYSINERSRIPEVLNKFQYGFLIRQKDVVNLVSSPIKFLEYLSCGVNVIMTDAVPAYAEIVRKYKVGTVVDLGDDKIIINEYSNQAKTVYKQLFDRDLYVEKYRKLITNESK